MIQKYEPRRGDRLLVVGFGPVAVRLVEELLPAVHAGDLRICVVGEEPRPGYNRVLVGEYGVGRVDEPGLALVDLDDWRSAGVEVRTGTAVTWLDRSARQAHLVDRATGADDTVDFDLVALAVGARANIPVLRGINPDPAAGGHLPSRVTVLRTPEEGCPVTVVHHRPWLLTRSTDAIAGAMLNAVLVRHGVEVVTDAIANEVVWQPQPPGQAIALLVDGERGRLVKSVVRDGVVVGRISLGMPRAGAELALLHASRRPAPVDLSVLLRLDGADGGAEEITPGSTVCRCAGVAAGTISEAIAGGRSSVEEVRNRTRAGSGCGSCRGTVERCGATWCRRPDEASTTARRQHVLSPHRQLVAGHTRLE